MFSTKIESLLEAANTSPDNDTSVNLAKRTLLDESDAQNLFDHVRSRLLNVNEWKRNSSVTDYDLFDEGGREINSSPITAGKYIRISLYGSGKNDWVRVEEIVDEGSEFVIVVRPSHDPTDSEGDGSTSHFFGPEARNNFCLQLNGKAVAFYVIGLHEKQNTRFTDSLIESARNAAVANIGYYSGLQKAVWKEFCKSMLDLKDAD